MLYAEDLTVGQHFPFREYPVTLDEILDFAQRFDPLLIHIDPVAAAKGRFGGLIASGLHTSAIYQRLIVEALWAEVAGVVGMRIETKFHRPVRPGMTLTGHVKIAAINLRPERKDAIVTIHSQITDGTDAVISVISDAVVYSRPDHPQP